MASIKNMVDIKTVNIIKITPHICRVTKRAIQTALEYEKVTGRKLGITGEIGEVIACDILGLNLLVDPIAAGHDAIDNEKNPYQIKTRRGGSNSGRLGSFSKHIFNYAIFVRLNSNYELEGLYKVSYKKLKSIIENHPKRNPTMLEFKRVAENILLFRKNIKWIAQL